MKNKSINESNNDQELILFEKTNINSNNFTIDDKAQKLTENNNSLISYVSNKPNLEKRELIANSSTNITKP